MAVLLSKLTVLGSSLSPDFTSCQSLIALGTAASLAQHRVQFIQQIRRHNGFSTQGRSLADGLQAMLRRNWQRHRLHVSGWRRGREELRLANIQRGSSEWDFWGLEHVSVLQAFGCGVQLMLESGVLGGPRVAVIK